MYRHRRAEPFSVRFRGTQNVCRVHRDTPSICRNAGGIVLFGKRWGVEKDGGVLLKRIVGIGYVQLEGQARQGRSAERRIIVLLQWLWEWKGSVQREEQAHSPTKSRCDSADVKPYKHTQIIALRKAKVIVQTQTV